jgi:hypothetical protein
MCSCPISPVGAENACRTQGEHWQLVGTWEGDAKVRAVPFDAIELDLSSLWADIRKR